MTRRRGVSAALWAPALGLGVLLVAWALIDILRVPFPEAQLGFELMLVLAALVLVAGLGFSLAPFRRLGVVLLAAAYFVPHALWIPLDVTSAIVYLAAVLAFVELRVLASRFAPLFEKDLTEAERRKVRGTLAGAAIRLAATAVMAVLLPIFAGDLALVGTLPLTTIPSAIALAGGLVVVVVLLALLPTWHPPSDTEESREAKPN